MATSGFVVFFHIFFDEIISILQTVIKVTFLNSVNIYLQNVPVILVHLVVISVSFLVISVIPGDFGNSWHRVRRRRDVTQHGVRQRRSMAWWSRLPTTKQTPCWVWIPVRCTQHRIKLFVFDPGMYFHVLNVNV